MKRFGEGDFFSDDDQNYDYDEEYSPEHEPMMMGNAIPTDLIQQWKRSEINLEEQKINFVILQQAIQLLQKSWLWRWRSTPTRIKMISDTYYALSDLMTSEE
jgi:hypothetical protein